MKAYRKHIVIQDPNHTVLTGLPFRPGEQVEVVVLGEDPAAARAVEELRRLLQETQSLPSARTVNEEDIAREIAAYREGR